LVFESPINERDEITKDQRDFQKIVKGFALVKSGVGYVIFICVSGVILPILCCSLIHFVKV